MTFIPLSAVEQDKQMHLAFSMAASSTCTTVSRLVTEDQWLSSLGCFALVTGLGIAKEVLDPQMGNRREMGDVYADLAGAGVGVTIISISFGISDLIKSDIRVAPMASKKVDQIKLAGKEIKETTFANGSSRFRLVSSSIKQ
jgi:hypothetical protein